MRNLILGTIFGFFLCNQALAVTSPGATELWQKARKARANEQMVEAAGYWRQLATQGDIEAQVQLAQAYQKGIGVLIDPKQSFYWFKKAAESGHPYAQYEVGLMYETGHGIKADYWEAEKWYHKALRQGYCPGEFAVEDL